MFETTLAEGTSVTRIARAHRVGPNQLSSWHLPLSERLAEQKRTRKLLSGLVLVSLPPATRHATSAGSASMEVAPVKLCGQDSHRTAASSDNQIPYSVLQFTWRTGVGRRKKRRPGGTGRHISG